MVKCSAYRCESDSSNQIAGLTFHRFPKDENLRRAWIDKMQLQPSRTGVLCSKHFEAHLIDSSVFRTRLRPGSIPTLFNELPTVMHRTGAKERPKTVLSPDKQESSRMDEAVLQNPGDEEPQLGMNSLETSEDQSVEVAEIKALIPAELEAYRCCAVPRCDTNSISDPNKLFIRVPSSQDARRRWLTLARIHSNDPLLDTELYFCENHFNLPTAMKSNMADKANGTREVRVCEPSRFDCQPDRTPPGTSRPRILRRQKHVTASKDILKRDTTEYVHIQDVATAKKSEPTTSVQDLQTEADREGCPEDTENPIDVLSVKDEQVIIEEEVIFPPPTLEPGEMVTGCLRPTSETNEMELSLKSEPDEGEAGCLRSTFVLDEETGQKSSLDVKCERLSDDEIGNEVELKLELETEETQVSCSISKEPEKIDLENIDIPEGKILIARVYQYLQQEYECLKIVYGDTCDLSPLADILERTADATGVSQAVVTVILEEKPPDRRKRRKRKRLKGGAKRRKSAESETESDVHIEDVSPREGQQRDKVHSEHESVESDVNVDDVLPREGQQRDKFHSEQGTIEVLDAVDRTDDNLVQRAREASAAIVKLLRAESRGRQAKPPDEHCLPSNSARRSATVRRRKSNHRGSETETASETESDVIWVPPDD